MHGFSEVALWCHVVAYIQKILAAFSLDLRFTLPVNLTDVLLHSVLHSECNKQIVALALPGKNAETCVLV